jgi:DNA-binding beta-propeller fold protein YncE
MVRLTDLLMAGMLYAATTATTLAAGAAPMVVAISDTSFSHPHDIALDAGGHYLFVADLGDDVVKVLDAKSLKTVGAIGEGELSSPHDVAFDRERRLVTTIGTGKSGRGRDQFNGPEGITARGGHVWIADTY